MANYIIFLLFIVMPKPQIVNSFCPPFWEGDGHCDAVCNDRLHNFDGGDCCESTCESGNHFACGSNGYHCLVEESAPSWFTRDTQLCYKWWADGDGNQCGGGVPDELCAHVGNLTAFYHDDTDQRIGGCRMQWKIKSPNAPLWFRRVQICYRWSADGYGDDAQCGGGADHQLCAPVGSYTPEYRDNTDNRRGGCRMSWKLSVPSNSQLSFLNIAHKWLLKVKLCYSWYPDEDGGQCGEGVGSEVCARANNWTPYYKDDTDNRPGGCRMAWKLVA